MGDIGTDIKSRFPNNRVKALINILYTAAWIKAHQNENFKPFGISPQQFNILKILNGAGEAMRVQQVKDRMIERSPNATRMMDKLCAKDLISREACAEDRRVVFINITKKGKALLDRISKSMDIEFLDSLSEKEAAALSDLLDKIRT